MDNIGNLIFNELASRREIILPEVGLFRIVRDTADRKNPVSKVKFEVAYPVGVHTVIDLMVTHGYDRQGAEDKYAEWLSKARQPVGLVVEGTGILKDGLFSPTDELNDILNPHLAPGAAPQKKYSNHERTWLVLIALFIIILAIGWTWWWLDRQNGTDRVRHRDAPSAASVVNEVVEPTVEFDRTEEEQPAIEEPSPVHVITPDPAPVATVPAITSTQGKDRYYIVGGVFSTTQNADKYIRETNALYPGIKFETMNYPGGKFLVGIPAGTDRESANSQRRKYAQQTGNNELWIYEKK